jgi:hypothetical protein
MKTASLKRCSFPFRPWLAVALAASVCTLSAQTLTHRYSFNEPAGGTTFADSVGGAAWAGTLQGNALLDGASLQLDGQLSYGQLPPGITRGATQLTVELWASFSADNPFWTRVFAFGDQNATGGQRTGLDYCHYAGGNWQNLNHSTTAGGAYANNPGGLNGAENVHITAVVDPVNNQMYYYNGTVVTSEPGVKGGRVQALSGLNDVLCFLGKSLHDVDATLIGAIHEFRVYSGVLPRARVALNDAAGPDNYVTDPGAIQAVRLSLPTNPLRANQSVLLNFTGDFANVTNVNLLLYGGASFTSGNTGILTVSSNGLVRAIAGGTTTIVASYGGLSATNTVTVLAVPAVLGHRYSFTADASDSVRGANGTLMGNATIASGKVVLDGSDGTCVDLPGALINLAANQAVTFEAWVDFGDVPSWSRLFDFGNEGGSSEIYLAPKGPGNGGEHRGVSQNVAGGQTIDWQGAWTNVSLHLAVVVDPPSGTLAVYRDGRLEYARHDATAPLSLVATNLAVLGRSLVPVDPYMPGAIDEFRIYRGPLTAQEIALSFQNGPGSVNRDPGSLQALTIPSVAYPAFSGIVPPVVLAQYANLTNFNLLPNNSAIVNGLVITSSDPAVIEVLPNSMLRTFRPGMVTLTASYLGKTASAVVTVANLGTLTHRYSFTNDASDSVGNAHGTLMSNATVAEGRAVLDGSPGAYVELPPALLAGYDAVTVDTWVTFNESATWARLWYFGNDRADELYLAPSVLGGSDHWYSAGIPFGGATITLSPRWENQSLHVTCIFGNGSMEYYTNGVFHGGNNAVTGLLSEVGTWYSWIGRSPYADPYLNCSVDEFRIYRGRLAPDEILASEILGPNQLLSASATLGATVSGSNLLLRWPLASAGFSLQAKSSFDEPWLILTNAPELVNDSQWQVSLPLSASPRFFRLWR